MIHHPPTYLNKVLVASSQGGMQLWNVRTQYVLSLLLCRQDRLGISRTLLHTFPATSLLTSPSKTSPNAITALVRSPAIDVVGIGFSSGEISVYDIRADERLMRMVMQDGAVRALSFRSG